MQPVQRYMVLREDESGYGENGAPMGMVRMACQGGELKVELTVRNLRAGGQRDYRLWLLTQKGQECLETQAVEVKGANTFRLRCGQLPLAAFLVDAGEALRFVLVGHPPDFPLADFKTRAKIKYLSQYRKPRGEALAAEPNLQAPLEEAENDAGNAAPQALAEEQTSAGNENAAEMAAEEAVNEPQAPIENENAAEAEEANEAPAAQQEPLQEDNAVYNALSNMESGSEGEEELKSTDIGQAVRDTVQLMSDMEAWQKAEQSLLDLVTKDLAELRQYHKDAFSDGQPALDGEEDGVPAVFPRKEQEPVAIPDESGGMRISCNPFPGKWESAKWWRVEYPAYSGSWHFITGEVRHRGRLLRACGVPGSYAPVTPAWLAGFNLYLPAKGMGVEGYWIMFQDEETGARVEVG